MSAFPVPDTTCDRSVVGTRLLDFCYVEAFYASYPAYVAALTKLGW